MNGRGLLVMRILVVGAFAGLGLAVLAVIRAREPGAPAVIVNPTTQFTLVPAGSDTPGPIVTMTPPPGVTVGPLDDNEPLVGDPAPDFQLLAADVQSVVHLAELRGKPVLVNFWASWCGPCREEMPDIQAAYTAAGGALEVIGVNVREADIVARGFAYNLGVDFPLVLDYDGAVAQQYRIGGLPVSYFIDAEGVIRSVNIGYLSKESLLAKLALVGVTLDLP